MQRTLMSLNDPALAPSILTADFGRLRSQIQEAEASGVDLIHLDIMDGHFVPNISFGPLVVSAVRDATTLPLDVHLMIQQPERFIDAFADSGADMISIHAESTPHPHRAIQQISNRGASAGLAINPGTPISAFEELLPEIDFVLLMTVNPGFGGQSFIQSMLEKIARTRSLMDQQSSGVRRIEVDGGINHETITAARAAGADIFVCGSSIFNDRNPVSESVRTLRSAVER